jgi:hypothetical protein
MGFSNVADVTTAIDNGQYWTQTYQKTSPLTSSTQYTDLSFSLGTPSYNNYTSTPLAFTPVVNTNNRYIYTGPTPAAGQEKFLHSWFMRNAKTTAGAIATYYLMDVVGFYTAIDNDSTDLQEMDNTQTLPRYTSGEGLRICAVMTLTATTGNTITIEYTNENDQIKTLTSYIVQGPTAAIVSTAENRVSNNALSLFFSLSNSDKGVKNIRNVTFASSAGGFMALLLVKPLAVINGSVGAPTEKDFIIQHGISMPKIENGAGLAIFSYDAVQGASAPTTGLLNFVWG